MADLLNKLVPIARSDFLGKFVEEKNKEDSEEIELSLGLSLNGHFGVDPKANNKLKRSSSIPEFMNPVKDEDATSSMISSTTSNPLIRTYSLPTETEEEVRKRKELQCIRRMEAKRKRSEKQRNAKASRDRYKGIGEESSEANGKNIQEQYVNEFSAMRMASSVSTATATGSYYGLEVNAGKKNSPEAYSSPESEQKTPVSSGASTTNTENLSNFTAVRTENHPSKPGLPKNGAKENARDMLEDMPCVSTRGNGPNGKRIEGFLYRYRKGEEVRIVCVCHGSFLTPAEFVKHAGGGDVTHPLKHIVVSPSFL